MNSLPDGPYGWRDQDAGPDEVSELVYLSNLIGGDPSLVQPGGGNTSVKLEEQDAFSCRARALVVKGSGSDLDGIGPQGFTHLYLDRLLLLRDRPSMSDEEMMEFMRLCMLQPQRDPLPSVETPLHSVLPFRFIAHTHDVATLSLTDTPRAEAIVRRVYGDEVAFLEYVRPGFPLARRLVEKYGDRPPEGALGLVLEKHGLVVWGETAKECYANLYAVIGKAETYVAEQSKGKRVFGPPSAPPLDEKERRQMAAAIMPAIRGELARLGWRTVLHLDDSEETLETIAGERFAEVASRGVMTPEHILRAGVRPLVLDLPLGGRGENVGATLGSPADIALRDGARQALQRCCDGYLAYARSHGQSDAISDFLKVILIPGVGMICAGRDKRDAEVAAICYRASVRAMAGAEAVERFEFLSDADACQVEYWPLERRKIEERAQGRRELEGKVAVVVGAASGIGQATAQRLAEEGAHVVLADKDTDGARGLESELNEMLPRQVHAVEVDVANEKSVEAAFREAVLRFGGVDVLFYSPGIVPELHSVAEMPAKEIERQMQVHFEGAVHATKAAARVMLEQGLGGRLVYNASKAAFAPGEGAAAYGASKAALVHYVRNVASELGRHAITANYINADAVDTPLFRGLLRERAKRAGKSEEETLKRYAERSVFGTATVSPQYVAEAVLFLASDRAAYTTGCVLTVGGGYEGFPR